VLNSTENFASKAPRLIRNNCYTQGLGIDARHQPTVALTGSGTQGPEQINKAILGLPWSARPAAGLGPEPAVAALLAKARFILKPEFDLPVRMGRLYFREPLEQLIF
jgi:hypothetical protein